MEDDTNFYLAQFRDALSRSDLELIEYLSDECHVDVNADLVPQQQHPLKLARNKEVVRCLIAKGASMTKAGLPEDDMARIRAALTFTRLGLLEYLLLHLKAELVDKPVSEFAQESALFIACKYTNDPEILDALLNKGGHFEVTNKWGETLLHSAASAGHDKLVLYLIQMGSDVDHMDIQLESPLFKVRDGHRGMMGVPTEPILKILNDFCWDGRETSIKISKNVKICEKEMNYCTKNVLTPILKIVVKNIKTTSRRQTRPVPISVQGH